MILYYGLTNYHLLCCILHKIIFYSKRKAIFVCSQGILKSRIKAIQQSGIFDEVIYLEDTKIRDDNFKKLTEKSDRVEIEEISKKFVGEYEKILPFDINDFKDICLAADHGVFGIYVLMKNKPYIYLEDGRGVYSNWKILDNLLKLKNPGIRIMSLYYSAYGKNKLIKERYIAFDSQTKDYDKKDCINFDVNELLDKLDIKKLDVILNIFEVKKSSVNEKKNIALILTQRFSAYKLLSENDSILLYALLADFFASTCRIYLKPHPADKCNYNILFNKETIINKEIPSELIRYIIDKEIDIGICTYSSSINSLKEYIKNIYNIDDSISNFKTKIYKLYILFELCKKIDAKIIINDEPLDKFFEKHYNLNENKKIIFNYSKKKEKDSLLIKDLIFEGANYRIKITKKVNNELELDSISEDEYLYFKVEDEIIEKLIADIEIHSFLPISKIQINANIQRIKKEGNMGEYIDLYDDNKKNTGIVIPREEENDLPEGKHILVSALIVENSENKIMMQVTSKDKGNILSLPSGHVLHAENSCDTIVRELFEEQGLVIEKDKITLVEERLANRIAFFDIYYMKGDYDVNAMVLQKEEVEDVIWMHPDDIYKAYDDGKVRKSTYESIRNFLNKRSNS